MFDIHVCCGFVPLFKRYGHLMSYQTYSYTDIKPRGVKNFPSNFASLFCSQSLTITLLNSTCMRFTEISVLLLFISLFGCYLPV